MDRNIFLIGAEQIPAAAHRMQDAAERMANVSSNIQQVFTAHERFLDDWLIRFAEVIKEAHDPAR